MPKITPRILVPLFAVLLLSGCIEILSAMAGSDTGRPNPNTEVVCRGGVCCGPRGCF